MRDRICAHTIVLRRNPMCDDVRKRYVWLLARSWFVRTALEFGSCVRLRNASHHDTRPHWPQPARTARVSGVRFRFICRTAPLMLRLRAPCWPASPRWCCPSRRGMPPRESPASPSAPARACGSVAAHTCGKTSAHVCVRARAPSCGGVVVLCHDGTTTI